MQAVSTFNYARYPITLSADPELVHALGGSSVGGIEGGSGRARILGVQGLVRNAELLLDLRATEPLLLRDEVPAEDAEDCRRSENYA